MRNMVSKWYEQKKSGMLTPSKLFIGSPSAKNDNDIMRQLNISGILGKNGEDHFLRMNSQIQEFDNIRREMNDLDEEKQENSDQKKQKADNPKSLFSLKGSQLASKLGDWAV